jgi:hypothetical protein
MNNIKNKKTPSGVFLFSQSHRDNFLSSISWGEDTREGTGDVSRVSFIDLTIGMYGSKIFNKSYK